MEGFGTSSQYLGTFEARDHDGEEGAQLPLDNSGERMRAETR